MSDDLAEDTIPQDEAQPVDAGSDDAPSSDISDEDRALTMGWTPKEQFKGDPEKWVDAKTFIKRGEEYLPFIKANNKRLERELEKAHSKLSSVERTLEKFAEHNSKVEQRAYERARRDLERELEDAAQAGDVETIKSVTKDMAELEREAAKPKDAGPTEEPSVVREWKAENPWFKPGTALGAAAAGIADELIAKGMKDPADYLPEVTKRIKAEFPEKFENPKRREAAAVESGGGPTRRTGKTYADLPSDAKQMCDEFVRDIKGFTREKFVKDYFAD